MRRLILVAALLVAACKDHGDPHGAPQPTVESHTTVVFPAGSPQLGSISLAPVEPRQSSTLRFTGRIVWDEDRTARVFSPFAGRVVSLDARPGDRVKAGQGLATLASPELGVAQSEARKTEQDLALAQKNFARVQELYNAGVAPLKDLQNAQADVARATAERERTQARLKLYGTPDKVNQRFQLRSPIAGVVVERNLNPGQETRPDNQPPDKPLFTVSDPKKLWFMLDVNENAVSRIKPGVVVQLRSSALQDQPVRGVITHVADLVDPQSRTVKTRGTVENPELQLKAEMFITAEVQVEAQGGLLVPARGIYLRGEQYFAFIEDGERRFTRRAVRPGPAFDGYQVVLQGLAATDKVVVEGNLLLERILASKD